MDNSQELLSNLTIYSKYARYIPELQRRETWDEIVTRNLNMHKKKYPHLSRDIDYYGQWVREKKILGAMRGYQFGGRAIERNPARQFNCSFLPMNNIKAFSEIMFLLLSGCGVGYSVQFHDIEQLPEIKKPKGSSRFLVGDSIEGWSDAVRVLIKAYFEGSFLPDFDFCTDPTTKILKADLTWVNAQEIKEGDEIIGFDEFPDNTKIRKLRTSKVLRITKIKQPKLKINTDKGSIIASPLHGFLMRGNRRNVPKEDWKIASDLKVGDTITFLVKPWEMDKSWEGGYLAGFLDGEGYVMGRGSMGFGQNSGTTLDRVKKLLTERGFEFTQYPNKASKCNQIHIRGGSSSGMRLMGMVRPQRLLDKLGGLKFWEGKGITGRGADKATILSIEELPEGEVIGIQTTTSTLITDGFFTHNSDIRSKGTPLKVSGGKAPGPEPLKQCLLNIHHLLKGLHVGDKIKPIQVHDINCFIADAVLSGGIRRSAMIALFSMDDEGMAKAKYGKWWEVEPQRARANNSGVMLRYRLRKKDFEEYWKTMEKSESGDPGFFFSNDRSWGLNPCGETSLRPSQFCNLGEINGGTVESQKDFNERAKAAAFFGTLQAGYTDFHYLREIWRKTTEKDALLGVGITGIASGTLQGLSLREAAEHVSIVNESMSKAIGINASARMTLVKPSGTSSCVLGTSSGIHAWHSPFYVRRLRFNKQEMIFHFLENEYSHMGIIEEDRRDKENGIVVLPIKAPDGAITRANESAVDLLQRVAHFHKEWVLPGHVSGNNTHSISATVSIKEHEWKEVGEWMWENRDSYNNLSILPYDGGTHVQAPFEEITEEEYKKRVKAIEPIDFTQVKEYSDETELRDNLACAGGSCEI